jgi:hypothetical protein
LLLLASVPLLPAATMCSSLSLLFLFLFLRPACSFVPVFASAPTLCPPYVLLHLLCARCIYQCFYYSTTSAHPAIAARYPPAKCTRAAVASPPVSATCLACSSFASLSPFVSHLFYVCIPHLDVSLYAALHYDVPTCVPPSTCCARRCARHVLRLLDPLFSNARHIRPLSL